MGTGEIEVNKKRHFAKGYKRQNKAKDGHEKLYSTVFHEMLHLKHPKMTEKNIRKKELKDTKKLTKKQKAKLLSYLK